MGRVVVGVAAAALLSTFLVACNSSGGGSQQHGTLIFADFNPFTGPDAAFGPEMAAGCYPAVKMINAAGGVMGHKFKCVNVDTRGDPADAVPGAEKLIATTTNLVGILGPSSDEATATVPIFNRNRTPMFVDTGQAVFDRTTDPYFWRITAPDDAAGYAMALWAHHQGYTRGAAIFGNDISSQGNVPTLVRGFTKVGGAIVNNQTLALDQSSYRTEVERMLAANPQVIFTEADPQTDATFLAELLQLNHGKMLPVIGTEPTLQPNWLNAVKGAIGSANLAEQYVGVQPYAPASGPGWQVFNQALLGDAAQVPKPSQWSSDPYTMTYYDGIVIMALAMVAAKSTSPSVYNNFIEGITQPGSGKAVVHSFAQGKSASLAGKKIQYVGAGGTVAFDRWHNSAGGFEISAWQAQGPTKLMGAFTAADISKISS